MGTWVFEGFASVGLFLVLLPALIPALIAVLYRRYRYLPLVPTFWAVVAFLYACALVAFTTFPLPDTPQDFCTERSRFDYWLLEPGRSIGDISDRIAEVGLTSTLTSGVFLQVAFNVVFFVPLGFLVAYLLRRGIGWAVGLGFATSLLIESTQGTGLWFLYPCPYRVAEVDDLFTNTSGAVIGWGVGWLVSRVLPFREPERRTDLLPPSTGRRILATVADLFIVLVLTLAVDVVLLLLADLRGIDASDATPWVQGFSYLFGAFLLLGIPLLRRDRATLGQSAVLVGLAPASGEGRVGPWSLVVRFVVRWLPILLVGSWTILVVAAVETATVVIRSDRRSLAGLLGKTTTLTRDRLEQGPPGG